MKLITRAAGGIAGSADAAGKAYMQYIQSFLKEAFEIIYIFLYIDLGGCGCSAGRHTGIELRKGNRLSQIIGILLSVQLVVKTNIVYVDCFEVLF